MELMMKAFLGLLIGMVKFYWDFTGYKLRHSWENPPRVDPMTIKRLSST